MSDTTRATPFLASRDALAAVLEAGVREWEDNGGELLPILVRHASGVVVTPDAEFRRRMRQAVNDPGSFVKRGPDYEGNEYGERPDFWQDRALAAALATPTTEETGT